MSDALYAPAVATYIVNCSFEGGEPGEIIDVNPILVEDWIEGGFITEIDTLGNRIILGDS